MGTYLYFGFFRQITIKPQEREAPAKQTAVKKKAFFYTPLYTQITNPNSINKNMYIEFLLPDSRLAAQWVRAHINKDIEHFCYHHRYTYQNETVYNKFRIRFEQLSAYTMFALEWQGKQYTLHVREDKEYPDIHPDYI